MEDSRASPKQLSELISATATCFLKPLAFFVSWHGVPTLAYRGFPPALHDLKRSVEAEHTGLPPEQSGSKWPKTSLGALREGRRLDPQQLRSLNAICKEESTVFGLMVGVSAAVPVESIATVVYSCRSLERLLSCQETKLAGGDDAAEPEAAECARVEAIVAEADSPEYWFAASRDGNRESHYRGPHVGATLVHRLEGMDGELQEGGEGQGTYMLRIAIDRFQARVEAELPGMYAWFAPSSLHVTLRALCG